MATVAERPDVRLDTEPPRAGDRFVGSGLLLLAALFVSVQVMAREVIPPLAIPAVVYAALGAAVLWQARRWLVITTIVLIVAHVASSIPFLAEALAHPETPASFLPDALIIIVAVAVFAGAIAGLRGVVTRRPITLTGGVLAAVVVVISAVAASGVDADVLQAGDVPIEAVGAYFPAQVQVPAGGAVLWVDNQDPFRHTLVIEGTDVHVELPGSTSVRVPTDLAPGTYRYLCDVPGHERMTGELVAR
jgi:plastocyanin